MGSTETVSFTVRMPKQLADALDRIAKRELSSRHRELLIAARSHVDADKRRTK